jgi:hypothetical protein
VEELAQLDYKCVSGSAREVDHGGMRQRWWWFLKPWCPCRDGSMRRTLPDRKLRMVRRTGWDDGQGSKEVEDSRARCSVAEGQSASLVRRRRPGGECSWRAVGAGEDVCLRWRRAAFARCDWLAGACEQRPSSLSTSTCVAEQSTRGVRDARSEEQVSREGEGRTGL